jgi:hypothetical protein
MHLVTLADTDPLALAAIAERALSLDRFVTGGDLALCRSHEPQNILPWELYQGRLVNPRHTRQVRPFECWTLHAQEAGQATRTILSVLRALDGPQWFVVRQIQSWIWEAYESSPDVFDSRLVARPVTELVGTIDLGDCTCPSDLEDDLTALVLRAVIGVSRLPLTSIEAPIPEFSFGRLGYFPGADMVRDPRTNWIRWLEEGPSQGPDGPLIQVKRLELAIRGTPRHEVARLACSIADQITATELIKRFRHLFNEVSLSPYTDFVGKSLLLLNTLLHRGFLSAVALADFQSWLLRHLVRHLTAYDLVRFHHRGANYPDALLLDELLGEFISLLESTPKLWQAGPEARVRRRALRQALVIRLKYQDLPVPALPTSTGENTRVLPEPFCRIADDEIVDSTKRSRRLFSDRPFEDLVALVPHALLVSAMADLAEPGDLVELGMAVFLDRPLGADKAPSEPDQTPLISHNAFSRSIAMDRLRFLQDSLAPCCDAQLPPSAIQRMGEMNIAGVRIGDIDSECRPGKVALADARLASPDFVVMTTTARTRRDILDCFDFRGCLMEWLLHEPNLLVLPRRAPAGVRILDHNFRPRLDLSLDPSQGYKCRRGIELPRGGLRIGAAWDSKGVPISCEGIAVPPVWKS